MTSKKKSSPIVWQNSLANPNVTYIREKTKLCFYSFTSLKLKSGLF
jgi:hypothetical protein